MTELTRPMRRKATLKDVAREAGVSVAAASYSFSGGGAVGEGVRLRVREAALRLGYRPNRAAQAVRTGRSMTLGLALPDLQNPYYPALAQAVEHAARRAGYTVVLIDNSGLFETELDGMRHLEDQGVAAAIWCRSSAVEAPGEPRFAMPVVIVGSPDLDHDTVTIRDREGGQDLARHLLDRGHRRLGIVSGASVPKGRDERTEGFLAEVAGRGEVVWQCRSPFTIDLDEAVEARLAGREATAVMCGNDLIAIGVLRAARRLGLTVPGDLSVVGFDDIAWASIVTPALTTVRQPVQEMAAAALTLLLDRLEDPGRAIRHFKLRVDLVQRDSVGPPR